MIGSFNCVYETPCGWCAKWDKVCDRKMGNIVREPVQYDNQNNKVAFNSCKNCTSYSVLNNNDDSSAFFCEKWNTTFYVDEACKEFKSKKLKEKSGHESL